MKVGRLLLISAILSCLSLASCGGGGGGGDDSSNLCGDINLKITGGEQCQQGRSPIVAVYSDFGNGSGMLCTGTLVTLDDVLTAAHCFTDSRIKRVSVIVDGAEIEVVDGAIHPGYNGSAYSPFDLAMITLARPTSIGPVPLLLSRNTQVGDEVEVFGYGKTQNGQNVFELGTKAPKAGIMKIGYMGNPGHFSAVYDETNTSVCHGDSGGPAIQRLNGMVGLVGTVQGGTSDTCLAGTVANFIDIQYTVMIKFILAYAPDVAVI